MPDLIGLQAMHGRKIPRRLERDDGIPRGVGAARIACRQHVAVKRVIACVGKTEPATFLRNPLHVEMFDQLAGHVACCGRRWG
jgi:hypothetical protein